MEKIDVSRYINRDKIEVEITVLTPMFLGGASHEAELRPAPFKAALRYWWRVLHGGETNSMRKREEEIFGSTEVTSSFSISVSGDVQIQKDRPPKGRSFLVNSVSMGKSFYVSIIDYLCYGLHEKSKYLRSHIQENSRFNISILNIKKEYKEELTTALKAFIKYGGLGARSRNGMGSLYSDFSKDFNILPYFKSSIKEYTTASEEARLFITEEDYDDWQEALSEVGIIYKDARCSLDAKHYYDNRGYVARPIIVQNFKDNARIPDDVKKDRFPKSYFLGVVKTGNKYKGQILFMPVEFYKSGEHNKYVNVYNEMNKYLLASNLMEELK